MNADMDVIVLEADGMVDDQNHGYGYHIVKKLEKHGYKAKLVPIYENIDSLEELPKKPLIISGGMTEVTSDVDWIQKLKVFIKKKMMENKEANASEKTKILGICFGAQLIAECILEGSVTFLKPPNMGLSEIYLEDQLHPLFKEVKNPSHAFSFHYNQIRAEGFNVLSSHKKAGQQFIQAFEVADSLCYGVQFHPEMQLDAFTKVVTMYKDLIEEDLGIEVNNIFNKLKGRDCDNSIILRNFMEL